MKKYVAFLGSAMFFVVCVSLYLMLDSMNTGTHSQNMVDVESKLNIIEAELDSNQKIIDSLKDSIQAIVVENGGPGKSAKQSDLSLNFKSARRDRVNDSVELNSNMCTLSGTTPSETDVQMLNVFDILPFDNPDGGAWKQGYDITYDESHWQNRKLKVFVIPHSHDDPGWIKTLEKYYSDQTRHILNLMVQKLEEHPDMRFIYAEMAFFTMWWNEISPETKEKAKRLIANGQLEIVTGGWVMTDEANAHYFAMLDQMIEGNQWLVNQVGVKPRSGWAIDPFGHSPTMTYLLKEMGFDNMLIQRTHYAIKKYLSKRKQLEFHWRQNWDHDGDTDMFCHMMPFYSYDVPHTCGPDPKICCQFDFKRLPGGKITCPWHEAPQAINANNVAVRARILLDQYRKKAQLYATDVLLVPLGDDFRYDRADEWDNQHNNYQQLFNYLNSHSELHVEAKFGTLSDYFDALRERVAAEKMTFPVLSGDFFTYADRDDHYWSGYFTSRPFYKCLDRILESHVRSADLLYTAALTESRRHGDTSRFSAHALMAKLVTARRSLGLYQHHDGITGTAKDHVVVDYGIKTLHALKGLKELIRDTAEFLMLEDKSKYDPNERIFDVDELRVSHDALPDKTAMHLTEESQTFLLYNSLTHTRSCVVRVHTDSADVLLKDELGNMVPTQVDPFWIDSTAYSHGVFKVSFVASLHGASLTKFTIQKTSPNQNPHNTLATISYFNAVPGQQPSKIFKTSSDAHDVTLENSELKLSVKKESGLLDTTFIKATGDTVKTSLNFLTYGTTSKRDKSGAYLFMPDGDAKSLSFHSPKIVLTTGPIMSEVTSDLPHVQHKLRLYSSPGLDAHAIEIMNVVDIRQESNKELTMRLVTDVQNEDHQFFTDLNGYQMIRRKWYKKLPIQANFYPMPSVAYVEDKTHRVSLLSAQSLGVASLNQGWLEIIQDRRLMQDDNRGVGQGVRDNKVTPNRFRLLIEARDGKHAGVPAQPMGYMSLAAFSAMQEVIHPVHIVPAAMRAEGYVTPAMKSRVTMLGSNLPCDTHLVNLRTLQMPEASAKDFRPSEETALILHRTAFDCSFIAHGVQCNASDIPVTLETILAQFRLKTVTSTSLSLIHDGDTASASSAVVMKPMQLKAFKLTLK